MNQDRLNQLIEATKTFEGFDMTDNKTCLVGVAGQECSSDLIKWLGVSTNICRDKFEYVDPVANELSGIIFNTGQSREEVIAKLEELRE